MIDGKFHYYSCFRVLYAWAMDGFVHRVALLSSLSISFGLRRTRATTEVHHFFFRRFSSIWELKTFFNPKTGLEGGGGNLLPDEKSHGLSTQRES